MLYLENLNDEQRDIVTDDRFLFNNISTCIIACAGSGKTRTLITKIIYMIDHLSCDPYNFFVTTFTKNAASEIKQRLLEHLDKSVVDKMTIGTFHSIAFKMFVTDDENDLVEENIESYLYKFYDHLKRTKSNYKYVFFDEYQDINEIQELIIKELSSHSKLVITVGDDQQNIYTFRNTNIGFILSFTKNYQNSEYKYLIKNYRCNKCIVDLANIVLENNKNKIDKTIIAMNESKPRKVKLIGFNSSKEQLVNLINLFKSFKESGKKDLHKIAVIARNNKTLKILEYNLALNNIPSYYSESSDNNLLTNISIQDVRDRIILSTIHGTKGLEFEEEYFLDVTSGIFPSPYSKDIEEERRLFYVGITRAIKKLTICYELNRPSVFITEILNNPLHESCVNVKNKNPDGIIFQPPTKKMDFKDYSISNLVANFDHNDFIDFIKFFDHTEETADLWNLHKPIPEIINTFCENRNLVVTNFSNILCDFVETFTLRTIQKASNVKIENFDYIIFAFYYFKEGLDVIKNKSNFFLLEKKFGINLNLKTDEELEKIIEYYKLGVKISGTIGDQISIFKESYENYISNKSSSSIIYDIFIMSLVKGIIKGRTSILQLINFDQDSFDSNKINKKDICIFKEWLSSVERSVNNKFNQIFTPDEGKVNICHTVINKETCIKTVIDIFHNDTILKIKSTLTKPSISTLIEIISSLSLCRKMGNNVNKCGIYNPFKGQMLIFDLSEWNSENDVLEFLKLKLISDC